MGLLHAFWFVAGVGQLIVLALEACRFFAQESDEYFTGLFQAIAALPRCAEIDAIGPGLLLVPACADAELEPASGDDVKRRGHVGQNGRMAIVDTCDQRTEADPAGGLRQGDQRCPALQAWAGRIREDRVK